MAVILTLGSTAPVLKTVQQRETLWMKAHQIVSLLLKFRGVKLDSFSGWQNASVFTLYIRFLAILCWIYVKMNVVLKKIWMHRFEEKDIPASWILAFRYSWYKMNLALIRMIFKFGGWRLLWSISLGWFSSCFPIVVEWGKLFGCYDFSGLGWEQKECFFCCWLYHVVSQIKLCYWCFFRLTFCSFNELCGIFLSGKKNN